MKEIRTPDVYIDTSRNKAIWVKNVPYYRCTFIQEYADKGSPNKLYTLATHVSVCYHTFKNLQNVNVDES